MIFFIKKIIQYLLHPTCFVFVILVISLVLIFFKKKLGRILLSLAIAIFYFLSINPVSDLLLIPLESRHAFLATPPTDVKHIVVLGGGVKNQFSGLPPSSRLAPASMARILEAIRLFNLMDDGHIITSGRDWRISGDEEQSCIQMRNLAIQLGVDEKRIRVSCQARDTYEEALQIKQKLDSKTFLLVTSAFHMPRAVYTFKKLGMNPIAAPCDFIKAGKGAYDVFDFLPRSLHLEHSSLAITETFGQIFYKLY